MAAPPPPPASEPDLFNELAASMFVAARKGWPNMENLVCSPLGVKSALAVAARNVVATLPGVSRMTPSPPELLACDSLRMGNLMHVDQAAMINKDFQALFESELTGKVSVFDDKDISASADLWASQLTDGAVRNVFGSPDHDVASCTKPAPPTAGERCLVNLVHFCGTWEEGFKQRSVQPFYAKPDQATMVPMMSQRNEFGYVRDVAYRCLRVPYNCGAQLVLLLPTELAGLDGVLPSLSSWDQLRAVLKRVVWNTGVTLTLPKVQLESRAVDLGCILQDPELGPLFRSTDPGGGPSALADIRLDSVYHKATLNLSERGDRSPLGFSPLMALSSPIPPNAPVHFAVDRPFMFLLMKNGFLLMMGLIRKLEPRKELDVPSTS